ncbi:MAG: sialidase family protein [Candidatus Thermoplasmatota archaeon]|nr:sialidase family protein [Candidatus Thermoplasmatota archaeon]
MKSDAGTRSMALLMLLMMISLPLFALVNVTGTISYEMNKQLTATNYEEKLPEIRATGTGEDAKVFVIYEDYTTFNMPSIKFKRSSDGGETFPDTYDFMQSPNDGDKQLWPSMDNEGDTIVVVYLDNRWRTIPLLTAEMLVMASISSNGGDSWTTYKVTPETLSDYPSTTMRQLHVDIDTNGNIFVVWSEKGRIRLSYSTNSGSTWSIPQDVKENVVPPDGQPLYDQFMPSVASNGDYVVVCWEANPDWKTYVYHSRASVQSGGSLAFSTPQILPDLGKYPYSSSYRPMIRDGPGKYFHVLWWDFITSQTANVGGDPWTRDRASVLYSRSTDNGATFSIGGKKGAIVNSSTPDGWHSAGNLAIVPNGNVVVTWVDYTQGKPAVYASTSVDGVNWSPQDRVTNFQASTTVFFEDPRIACDDSGNVHLAWIQRSQGSASQGDIYYSRSVIPNDPPASVENLQVYLDNNNPESKAFASWELNREPDFKEYRIYLGTEPGFILGTPIYNTSVQDYQQHEMKALAANTNYYLKIMVVDSGDLSTLSPEVHFKTFPINEPPRFTREIPTIYMDEDSSFEEAMNFTKWRQEGWIWDDDYNGHVGLQFEITALSPTPNVTALIREYGLNVTYQVLDLYTNKQNWFGTERFLLKVMDSGKDGSFGTPDDRFSIANLTVRVNSTNDVPTWVNFEDLSSGRTIPLLSNQTKLDLRETDVTAIEGQLYRFALRGDDVDGDFLEFTCSDPRVLVEPDRLDPRLKSTFRFTPMNEDVPEVTLFLTMFDRPLAQRDGTEGKRNLTMIIPIMNVNDAPFFISIDEKPFVPGTVVRFEMLEESTLEFNVTGDDPDTGDELRLLSDLEDRVVITRTNASEWSWRARIDSTNDDPVLGYIAFHLILQDKQRSDLVMARINITVINTPDPPEWMRPAYDYFFVYDEKDRFEFGGDIKPGGGVIRAEWGETVRFEAYAFDSDYDVLNYTWTFTNKINTSLVYVKYGPIVNLEFYPSDGDLTKIRNEDFTVNITVSDGLFPAIYREFDITVWPDDDNDNDGIPDRREKFFFDRLVASEQYKDFDPVKTWKKYEGDPNQYDKWKEEYRGWYHYKSYERLTPEVRSNWLLLFNNSADIDRDGYSNFEEIGIWIPLDDREKRTPYSLNMDTMDPLNPEVKPGGGGKWPPLPPDIPPEKPLVPPWVLYVGGSILLFLVLIGTGIFVILRWNKKKEEEEDIEIERRIKETEKRQEQINKLYGGKYKAGDAIGPDQSTLSDLRLDLGGSVYHEEGSSGIVDESGKKKQRDGPNWESTVSGGPLFEKTDAKLEFGESLQLEAIGIEADIGEMDHSSIDEEGLSSSMDEILNAAEKYDPSKVTSTDRVQIGAMTMEQKRQMENSDGGPRLPPPGQEPPKEGPATGPPPPPRPTPPKKEE